jgi:hypothetical protein
MVCLKCVCACFVVLFAPKHTFAQMTRSYDLVNDSMELWFVRVFIHNCVFSLFSLKHTFVQTTRNYDLVGIHASFRSLCVVKTYTNTCIYLLFNSL